MTDVTLPTPQQQPSWRPEPMSERIVVRCFSRYDSAGSAVDRLTSARIPRQRISVFGSGLRWQEGFTATRFIKGAGGGGGMVAAAVALLLWSLGALDGSFTWLTATAAGGALGSMLGAAAGVAAWRLTRPDGTVPETGHVDVDHYIVLVESPHADRARELLDD